MLSCMWNYITASVFRFLTSLSSLFLLLSSQLSENTAEVVKMALSEMDVESRLSSSGLLFSGKAESGGVRIH